MPVIQIDGVGKVEVDDSFLSMSPDEQNAVVSSIMSQAKGSGGGGSRSGGTSTAPSQPKAPRGERETYQALEGLVREVAPNARFTSTVRSPEHNREVGGAKNSYHITGQAVDLVGVDQADLPKIREHLKANGVNPDEFLRHDAGSGMHLHIAAGNLPDSVYQRFAPQSAPSGGAGGQGGGSEPPFQMTPEMQQQILAYVPQAKSVEDLNQYTQQVTGGRGSMNNAQEIFDFYHKTGKVADHVNVDYGNQPQPQATEDPLAGIPNPQVPQNNADAEIGDTLKAAGSGFLDSASFGFDDEAVSGVKALGGLFTGEGLVNSYLRNRDEYRAEKDRLAEEHPWAHGIGELGGIFVPGAGWIKGGGMALKGGKALARYAQAAKSGAKAGAVYGGIYGLGSGEGGVLDQAGSTIKGIATGAVGGAVLGPAAQGVIEGGIKLAPFIPGTVANFVRKNKNDPLAPYDAEIVQRLNDQITSGVRTPRDAKGTKEALPVTAINDVGESFVRGMTDQIKRLPDLGSVAKNDLILAINSRKSITPEQLDQLLGDAATTVAGKAVKDGITRFQRTQLLTKQPVSQPSMVKRGVEWVGNMAGASQAGPVGALAGSALRKMLLVGGEDVNRSAARYTQKLATGRSLKKYQALAEEVGPSGADASQAALKAAADRALNAQDAEKARRAVEAAQRKAEQKIIAKENIQVARKADLDNVRPTAGEGWRGHVYEQTGLMPKEQDQALLKMVQSGAISPEVMKRALSDPMSLMKGNAGNKIVDRMKQMVDEGLFPRDPKWKPPEPKPANDKTVWLDANGQPIRSMGAYAGGIVKNVLKEIQP